MGRVDVAGESRTAGRAAFGDGREAVGILSRVRGLVLPAMASLCAAVAILALSGAPAQAGLAYPFDAELTPSGGSFGNLEPNSVAVDDFNGETYVADSSSGTVDIFETLTGTQPVSGTLEGSSTPAKSFGGGHVAVTANNATGDVYVLDSNDDVVDVFDSSGAYVCQITGSATPSASECNGPAGSDTPPGGFVEPEGIAVDQTSGEIYVLDPANYVENKVDVGFVDVFSMAGAYLRRIALASTPGYVPGGGTRGIAVSDFNGGVYVSDNGDHSVNEFNAADEWVATWKGANTPAGSFGEDGSVSVAVDNESGLVYVGDSEHDVVDVFGAAGEYVTQFSHSFNAPGGVAVDEGSGRVYVSNNEPGVVDILGPAVVVPDVVTGAPSDARPTSLTLNGTVNPDGVPATSCEFEYIDEVALKEATGGLGYQQLLGFGLSVEFLFANFGTRAPCTTPAVSPAEPLNGNAPVAVSTSLSGLQEGAIYHFRLVAGNANGANQGSPGEITMPTPPSIDGASAENLAASTVDLRASINPDSAETSYRFEYGTSTAYGTSVPIPDGAIPSGSADAIVTQHVTGLEANTTYHWRVVAHNVAGTTTGADHTFIYDTAGAGLPDGRAYEMVTPPQKNGALIGDVVIGLPPDISEGGSRVILTAIQCFGGAQSCTGTRQTEGEQFLFTRTSGGWAETPLAPLASQFIANSTVLVSAEAGTELFSIPIPPTGAEYFYARQPDGSFLDLGPTTPPTQESPSGLAQYNGYSEAATADLSHVVFQQGPNWPFDETLVQSVSLYEFVGAEDKPPVLVGVSGGPGSDDLISKCRTELGSSSNGNTPGEMSADGEIIYFTAIACASGSGLNATTPVPANTVYARIGGARTVQISAGGANALFQGASADGSRAFFTESEGLFENECLPAAQRCGAPAEHTVTDVSAGDSSGEGPRVQGVVAISADGSHVYFVARGVLSDAANRQGGMAQNGADNLYVYERDASHPAGRVAFIAVLPISDESQWHTEAGATYKANVTPEGRFLVFESHAALTPDHSRSEGPVQIYRYDAQTGEIVRISVGEQGFNDNGNDGVVAARIVEEAGASIVAAYRGGVHAGPARRDPTMSNDGSYVFFQSPVALTPHALNDVELPKLDIGGHIVTPYAENVYEYHDGRVSLISDGQDVSSSRTPCVEANIGVPVFQSAVCLLGTDATGHDVFFTTADRLVPQDTDTQLDFYDARICEPEAGDPCITSAPPPLPPCLGEACHGTPPATPSLLTPGSASFNGAGNLTPAPPAPGKPKSLTKAQKLAKALKACKKQRRKKRAVCEKQARKRYAPASKRGKR